MFTYNPVPVLSPESVPDLGGVPHLTTVSVHHSRGGPRLGVVSEPQIYPAPQLSMGVLPGQQGWRARQGLGRVEVRKTGGLDCWC